jgi:hypothetical protein
LLYRMMRGLNGLSQPDFFPDSPELRHPGYAADHDQCHHQTDNRIFEHNAPPSTDVWIVALAGAARCDGNHLSFYEAEIARLLSGVTCGGAGGGSCIPDEIGEAYSVEGVAEEG